MFFDFSKSNMDFFQNWWYILKKFYKELYNIMMKTVEIYTDGACSGNPGPGGYGIIMTYKKHKKVLVGIIFKSV